MQLTGMLWGRKLLDLVEFPHSEVRGPELSVDEIKDMIKRHGQIFIKPLFTNIFIIFSIYIFLFF